MSIEDHRLAHRVAEFEGKIGDLTAAFHQFRLSVRGSLACSVISSAPSEAAASGASSIYNDLATEIPVVPDFCVRSCSLLSGQAVKASPV